MAVVANKPRAAVFRAAARAYREPLNCAAATAAAALTCAQPCICADSAAGAYGGGRCRAAAIPRGDGGDGEQERRAVGGGTHCGWRGSDAASLEVRTGSGGVGWGQRRPSGPLDLTSRRAAFAVLAAVVIVAWLSRWRGPLWPLPGVIVIVVMAAYKRKGEHSHHHKPTNIFPGGQQTSQFLSAGPAGRKRLVTTILPNLLTVKHRRVRPRPSLQKSIISAGELAEHQNQ